MDIGSNVRETGAHRILSLFAEILNSLLALLLLRVQALPEFVVALFPALFSASEPEPGLDGTGDDGTGPTGRPRGVFACGMMRLGLF